MFDYEVDVFNQLFNSNNTFKDKHLFIVKATGLGITELSLRIIAWLCTKDDKLKGSQICIVTGPRIELAITLIDRLKVLFYNLGVTFSDKETVLNLNDVHIEAYPSHHLDSMRGLANVSFIYLDEADFFPDSQQKEARDISERYIAKSNPYIVLSSTPNKPDSLFYNIEQEKEEQCIYKRIRLPYDVGLNNIFTQQEIDKQMASPSFKREYCLAYEGQIGNVFTPMQIDEIVKLGNKYKDIPIDQMTIKSLAVDWGFSSSQTGIVLLEHINPSPREDKIIVRYTQIISKGDLNQICDKIWDFYLKYQNLYIFCDGSNRAATNLLKIKFGESLDWQPEEVNPQSMRILPVNFNTEHKNMLSHLQTMVSQKYLIIPEEHKELIISLKTAFARELTLDKDQTSYDDVFDALRMGLKAYEIK